MFLCDSQQNDRLTQDRQQYSSLGSRGGRFHPTSTWSPSACCSRLQALLPRVRQRWNCDPVQKISFECSILLVDARQKRLCLLRIGSNGLVYSRICSGLKVLFDIVRPIEGLGRAEDDRLSIDRGVLAGMFFRAEFGRFGLGLVTGSNGQLECFSRRSTERKTHSRLTMMSTSGGTSL
jgi:hypothetical protein